MTLNRVGTSVLTALVLLLPACNRKPAAPVLMPPPAAPLENPTSFSITETNIIVAEADMPTELQSQIVRADFNSDRLEDVAVAEQDDTGRHVVSIYLRRSELRKEFFKAGGIAQAGDYTISALMSSTLNGKTDLLTIFTYPDGHKELAHFRSDGKHFRELSREVMTKSPTSATNAPPA